MKQAGLRAYFTKVQLREGEVPDTVLGRKFLSSYSPEGGWYVMGVPEPYAVGPAKGAGPRVALYLRYPRSIGFLRASISAWQLSNTFGAGRYGDDVGIAARHQRAHPMRLAEC